MDVQELSATLYSLRGYLGAALDVVRKDAPELVPQFSSLRDAIEDLRKEMLRGDANQVAANALKLAEFQQSLFDDVRDTFEALKTQDNRAPLSVADLPPALRDRFVGVTGKYLLMVYPKDDIWKPGGPERFIDQVGKIYPDVTGTPVQLYHYTALLKSSYEQAAWYSLGAIVILVFLHFRSLALRRAGAGAGGGRFPLAGRLDGLAGCPAQSGEYHDPAARHRHRRDQWHSHSQPVCRRANAEHPGPQHRQGRAGLRIDGDGRFRQLDPGAAPGHTKPGLRDDCRAGDLHDCGVDVLAGAVESPDAPARGDRTTQCRQCTIDTGSGGTEVKTSSMQKD